MKTVYFDCFAGISGDMTIGALLDAGVDFDALKNQLATLALSGYELSVEKVKRSGIAATKFNVKVEEEKQPARKLADISEIIHNSPLSESVKARSMGVFEKLAIAEAHVHGTTVDRIHFHEVGAVDSIIDVIGAMIGFELLDIENFLASPLRVGFGAIQVAHGVMPVPAPATAELVKGLPVYAGEIEGEFVTPTGAAIVAALCESYGTMPMMQIERIAYGAGTRNPKGFPNALRIVIGEVEEGAQQIEEAQTVVVIETNIDDMNPQAYGYVMDKAFALGALDVFVTPIQMKKDRPAVMLTALCERKNFEALVSLILSETTTLGVRYYEAKRRTLARQIEEVETAYGKVRVKVARLGNRTLHFQPEFEDCAKIAEKTGISLIEIQSAASAAYRGQQGTK
jgi:pyridinium-3,5-bisthiocarboxylic acid mononucleotide nickel chelatase